MSHRAGYQNDLDVIRKRKCLHGAKVRYHHEERRHRYREKRRRQLNKLSSKHSSQKDSSETKMASVTLEIQDALAVVTVSNSPLICSHGKC